MLIFQLERFLRFVDYIRIHWVLWSTNNKTLAQIKSGSLWFLNLEETRLLKILSVPPVILNILNYWGLKAILGQTRKGQAQR